MEEFNILQAIVNNTSDIILVLDGQGITLFVSPSIESNLGYQMDFLYGKNAFGPLHPKDRNEIVDLFYQTIAYQQPVDCCYRVYDAHGNLKYLEARVVPVVENNKVLYVVVVARDITERKQAEIDLKRSEERYRLLQKSLNNFSTDLSQVMKASDLEKRLVREIQDVLQIDDCNVIELSKSNEAVHLRVRDGVIHPDSSVFLQGIKDSCNPGTIYTIQQDNFIKIGEIEDEIYFLWIKQSSEFSNDEKMWLETIIHYVSLLYDNLQLIERLLNRIEEILHEKETPVWVLRLLFKLQEKERFHLSSDLHDSALQDLIHTYRRLENLTTCHTFKEDIFSEISSIEQGILDIIHLIRTTCNELRPPFLTEIGLIQVLENLFTHTQLSNYFSIEFNTKITDIHLKEEKLLGLYRVVQELLNNASKHSDASEVTFTLDRDEHEKLLVLEYEDNGIGMELDEIRESFDHMGISGIYKRVQSLEGIVEMQSIPSQGLKVTIKVPFG